MESMDRAVYQRETVLGENVKVGKSFLRNGRSHAEGRFLFLRCSGVAGQD